MRYNIVEGSDRAEKKKLMEQYEEMVERGDVKVKDKLKKTKLRKARKVAIVEDN